MKIILVSLLVAGVALASPIVVREPRSWYGGPGLLGAPQHGQVTLGNPNDAASILAAFLANSGASGGFFLPQPAPVTAAPPSHNDYDYDYSDDNIAVPAVAVVAPASSGPTAVAPATFPPLDEPGTTPAPALAGPTLDGPTVPALVLHGPSGTIRTGPLSTGAVSLAGHVPPAHPAPVH